MLLLSVSLAALIKSTIWSENFTSYQGISQQERKLIICTVQVLTSCSTLQ